MRKMLNGCIITGIQLIQKLLLSSQKVRIYLPRSRLLDMKISGKRHTERIILIYLLMRTRMLQAGHIEKLPRRPQVLLLKSLERLIRKSEILLVCRKPRWACSQMSVVARRLGRERKKEMLGLSPLLIISRDHLSIQEESWLI